MSNVNNVLKNIILISDVKGACVDAILSTGLYNIKLLVVPYKKCVDELKHKYGDKVENYLYYIPDTNTEFQEEFESNYNLSYIDVIKYRDVQFKCYRHNLRYLFDDNANNSIYYTALKYFLGFFATHKIDMVFSRILEHGSISDSLLFEIAKQNNIPVYIVSMNTACAGEYLQSIIRYNDKTFVDISSVDKSILNFSKILQSLSGNYSNNKVAKLPFSKMIKKFLSKKDKTLTQCIKWFYEKRIKLHIRYIHFSMKKDLYKLREETSLSQIMKGFFYVRKLKKLYKKISIKKIGDDNFIFFPLHMEPEAANLARATMGNQLFIIEQISKLLPEGWFLYVKEHPDQFAAAQVEKYFYRGIPYFRNIDFYRRLTQLKNVKIINVYTPSSTLIDKSSATLSIAGSALVEAVAKNKPIIVFGDGTTIVELLNDSCTISEFGMLSTAIDKIVNGFTAKYSDFEQVMDKYVFSINNDGFYGKNTTLEGIFKLLYKLPMSTTGEA